jgi:hypothetical protein
VIPDEISVYAADSSPYGMPYGRWTIEWWKWIFAVPKSKNPVLDSTGRYANIDQKFKDVFFLAGKIADEKYKCFYSNLFSIYQEIYSLPRDKLRI